MKFLEALKCGHEPRCMGCVHFDRRAINTVVGSPIINAPPTGPKVTVGVHAGYAGTCREGPPTMAGWITVTDGTVAYCGKWDDGEESARPSSDGLRG